MDQSKYREALDTLRKISKSKKRATETIELTLNLHAMTHEAALSDSTEPTYLDIVYNNLKSEDLLKTLPKKGATIPWHIWHITRIEDLISNILIAGTSPILDEKMLKLTASTIKDTGNAMTDEDIQTFSKAINFEGLVLYRKETGRRTREILRALTPERLMEKPSPENIKRIMTEGGLTNEPKSYWLLDFWANKTILGLMLLPVTNHHMMHLPECEKIKSL